MLRLDLHSRLLNRTGASSWHDIAGVVRLGKGPRRMRRIPNPTPTYQPHEGQQYMPLPTTRPISSPISFTERTPLLSSPQVAHYTPHKWVVRAKSTSAEAACALRAITLGLLLNILGGIPCRTSFNAYACRFRSNNRYHVISDGMIIAGVFMKLGTMGVSMFFVSYVISLG